MPLQKQKFQRSQRWIQASYGTVVWKMQLPQKNYHKIPKKKTHKKHITPKIALKNPPISCSSKWMALVSPVSSPMFCQICKVLARARFCNSFLGSDEKAPANFSFQKRPSKQKWCCEMPPFWIANSQTLAMHSMTLLYSFKNVTNSTHPTLGKQVVGLSHHRHQICAGSKHLFHDTWSPCDQDSINIQKD